MPDNLTLNSKSDIIRMIDNHVSELHSKCKSPKYGVPAEAVLTFMLNLHQVDGREGRAREVPRTA